MDDFKENEDQIKKDKPVEETNPVNLKGELDDLAKVFQEELDKTTQQASDMGLIQDLDLEDDGEDDDEDDDETDSENLCECCGESEKEEGKPYCKNCIETMRRYPFRWVYFLFLALVIYLVALAGIKIVQTAEIFVDTYKGDVLFDSGYFEAAQTKYADASSTMYVAKVDGRLVYARTIKASYELGQVSEIYNLAESEFDEWELNLPHMRKIKKIVEESQVFSATATDIQSIISEYSNYEAENLPYQEIIDKIDKLAQATLYIGLTENGEETTVSADEGTEATSEAAMNPRKTKYHNGLILYYKYYIATVCEIPYADRVIFLEGIAAQYPKEYWLYGLSLGTEYAKNGQGTKANELANEMLDYNKANTEAYAIKAMVARIDTKDYQAAIKICDQGLAVGENYELYRQKALLYLLIGDSASALEQAQNAYDSYVTITSCDTLAFCALVVGNTEKYNEIKAIYDSNKLEFSDNVKAYANGQKTIEDILCSGEYDLI